jgi:hypothetical protein
MDPLSISTLLYYIFLSLLILAAFKYLGLASYLFSSSNSDISMELNNCPHHDPDCAFCEIIAAHEEKEWALRQQNSPFQRPLNRPRSPGAVDLPSKITSVIYSTPFVVVFSPRQPAARRHLLVVPRKHIKNVKTLIQQAQNSPRGEAEEFSDEDNESRSSNRGGINSFFNPFAGFGWNSSCESPTDDTPRRYRTEEEKELNSKQLLSHMVEVGELVLSRADEVLTDYKAGLPGTSQGWLRKWLKNGKSYNHQSGGNHSNLTDEPIVEEFDLDNYKPTENNPNNSDDRRRESQQTHLQQQSGTNQADSTVTKRSVGNSTEQAQTKGNSRQSSGNHSKSKAKGLKKQEESVNHRFAFHIPPFNSINHLHMHCFELPFTSTYNKLSYRANTYWCQDAVEIKKQIISNL